MSKELTKTVIIYIFLVLIITMLVLMIVLDFDLGFLKLSSIQTLLGKHDEILTEENKLKTKKTEYENTLKKVDESKSSYDTEKAKYEAISDETINVIKEATTEEYYDIEYMWITLGNYAKSNNLSIIMSEPGGNFTEASANKDGSQSNEKTTSSTESTTSGNATASSTTTSSTTSTDASKTATQDTSSTSSSNTMFKIQVTGSYLDVSDFIFEVENDKTLRFKLDNISMDYVSGNTIKASFNVKNLVINK